MSSSIFQEGSVTVDQGRITDGRGHKIYFWNLEAFDRSYQGSAADCHWPHVGVSSREHKHRRRSASPLNINCEACRDVLSLMVWVCITWEVMKFSCKGTASVKWNNTTVLLCFFIISPNGILTIDIKKKRKLKCFCLTSFSSLKYNPWTFVFIYLKSCSDHSSVIIWWVIIWMVWLDKQHSDYWRRSRGRE